MEGKRGGERGLLGIGQSSQTGGTPQGNTAYMMRLRIGIAYSTRRATQEPKGGCMGKGDAGIVKGGGRAPTRSRAHEACIHCKQYTFFCKPAAAPARTCSKNPMSSMLLSMQSPTLQVQ